MDERCHVWAISLHNKTKKGRTQLNTVHYRGQQDPLPRQNHYPDCGNTGGQMLFNSIISTKSTHFMTMDIASFYLMTLSHRSKFIQMKLSDTPNGEIEEYKFKEKAIKNGSIYIRAKRGMYGLPQSGLLANKFLEKQLNKHGYQQSKLVPGHWKHDTRPIQFTFVVNNFGVKYVGEEHAHHLKNALEEHNKLA